MVRQWLVLSSGGNLRGIDEAGQHNSTSTLNVVVENGVSVTECVKVFEGVIGREILMRSNTVSNKLEDSLESCYLKLNEQLRECLVHFIHELLHEFPHLGIGHTTHTSSEIQGVVEITLSVCAQIETNRDSRLRSDTGDFQLVSNGDAHP